MNEARDFVYVPFRYLPFTFYISLPLFLNVVWAWSYVHEQDKRDAVPELLPTWWQL